MKPREFWIKDQKVIVDDEDFSFIQRFKWHLKKDKQTHYAYTAIYICNTQTQLSMHRLITGIKNSQIDHKNRNGLDNRKENLRFCTAQQNQFNRVRKNKFGFRGVFQPTRSSNFSYQIQISGKRFVKNGFKTPQDAARAYDKMNKELHGEFGIRNFED